ncbi:MAG: hypothetical protein KGK08_11295 [Acidobacteriota bacterium]|nr:hypothetical protein [Acidobacteriota bacterium]
MSLDAAVQAVPTMLIIWAVVTACFVAILTYRGQLTRYEQERLFLMEIDLNGEQHQSAIVRRIHQIQPYVRILAVASSLLTISIVTIWTMDAWRTLHS